MQKRRLALLLVFFLGPALPAGSTGSPSEGRDFGNGVTLTTATPLREVLAAPARFSERPVLVRGRLTDLCTRKGCWTVLADGDDFVRVRFLNYGFFLPEDAIGASAWVEGVAEIRTLSEGEARHLASETRGGDPSAINGPQQEIGFVASGVRLFSDAAR
jgi:hypothetical protein